MWLAYRQVPMAVLVDMVYKLEAEVVVRVVLVVRVLRVLRVLRMVPWQSDAHSAYLGCHFETHSTPRLALDGTPLVDRESESIAGLSIDQVLDDLHMVQVPAGQLSRQLLELKRPTSNSLA